MHIVNAKNGWRGEQWMFIWYDIYQNGKLYHMWKPAINHVYDTCIIICPEYYNYIKNMSQEVNINPFVSLEIKVALTEELVIGAKNLW